ncbi:MAG: NAD-dependent epimerase/dehydratase family protein [Nitrososphaerales archaeon]
MKNVSKAIVTGGAGFIGSHIVDELIKRGIETVVIDDFTTGSAENLRQHKGSRLLRVVTGDAARIGQLLPNIDDVDVVFHEAAIASVPRSVADPLLVHNVNVNASLAVMAFCVSRMIRRMVFASSAAVYGVLNGIPASEDLVCAPASPYGASKFAVEAYLAAFYQTYGLETVGLRYFNVYGSRQKMSDYSGVITVFANKILQHSNPVIYGDGLQTRDFVHVKDIVNANMLAMESGSAPGQVLNVASGRTTNLLQLIDALGEITASGEIEPVFEPSRKGDVRSGAASISKIGSLLGYRPSVSLLDGLVDVVNQSEAAKETMAVTSMIR